MIDLVVTYVYERDKKWQQDFKYWKDKEISLGITDKKNRQAFGIERTREWDTFKYFFRSVEVNCSWINRIILIVQNKNHIPKWLNKDKVKIVYHEDYIPSELLPTFNAMPIGFYVSNIQDLQEQYLMCDDDFIFLNPIAEDRFFKDGKPVHEDNKIPYEPYIIFGASGLFMQILNNNLVFEERYMKNKVKYGIYHLPEARLKDFEQEIIQNNKQEILDHFIKSKFRHQDNLCHYMFSDLLKICNKAYIGEPYKNCSYVALNSKVKFNDYWDKDIVCFNDTEILDDYELTKKKYIEFLQKKFPNKSSYEV